MLKSTSSWWSLNIKMAANKSKQNSKRKLAQRETKAVNQFDHGKGNFRGNRRKYFKLGEKNC